MGRVMDLPYAYVDSLAKMIPNELNITIDRALQINPELRKMYETDEQVKELDQHEQTFGGASQAYLHACRRGGDLFQTGGRTGAFVQGSGWFHYHPVYHDYH